MNRQITTKNGTAMRGAQAADILRGNDHIFFTKTLKTICGVQAAETQRINANTIRNATLTTC